MILDLEEQHIIMVRLVNEAEDEMTHRIADIKLHAWRDGVEACGRRPNLMGCDLYYLDQGIDRPMCCGVFLDWEPKINTGADQG